MHPFSILFRQSRYSFCSLHIPSADVCSLEHPFQCISTMKYVRAYSSTFLYHASFPFYTPCLVPLQVLCSSSCAASPPNLQAGHMLTKQDGFFSHVQSHKGSQTILRTQTLCSSADEGCQMTNIYLILTHLPSGEQSTDLGANISYSHMERRRKGRTCEDISAT